MYVDVWLEKKIVFAEIRKDCTNVEVNKQIRFCVCGVI